MLHTIEQIGIGIAYWDFRNHKVHWSKQLAVLYGLETEPFYRSCQDYLKYIHPEDRVELKSMIKQVEQTRKNGEVEYRVYIDRQEKWFRSSFSPVIESDGLAYIIEFVTDISELKSAQAALVYSELRWRSILGCISDVLIETTFSGEIISTTDSIVSLWGYHPEELRGINLRSIVEFEEGFSFETPSSIDSDFRPISATANVLLKSLSCRTSQCRVHVDTVRQTLLFIFTSHPSPAPQPSSTSPVRSVIPNLTYALANRCPLPTLYSIVSEHLAGLLQADCVHIYQYHLEQTRWHTIYDYCQHPNPQCAARIPSPEKDMFLPQMLDRLEPTQIHGSGQANHAFVSNVMTQVVGTWMVLPILVNASLWGCILVMRLDKADRWTEQEFSQAISIGDYLNLAIAARRSGE
ncbi:PAS domain S-box protein [Egbenema bharatensis]|uniref:PAS domain S-box protein n=1 Tax=Egbenema bharatensis TaxID=3463334 RepID=UPI003A838F1F